MGDSHESLQAEVQQPRALIPSTAALHTRPPQPAAPAAGRGCSEAPKAGGPGAPRLRQAGLPAPLRPCCSQLCGAAVCHFLPLPVRAPAASCPAAEDTIRSCLEQQVFSGSKSYASRSGPPRFSLCPPLPPLLCGDPLPSTPYFRSCRNVTSSQRPAGWFFNCNRSPLLHSRPLAQPTPLLPACPHSSHLEFHFLQCSLFVVCPSPLASKLLESRDLCFVHRGALNPSRAPGA